MLTDAQIALAWHSGEYYGQFRRSYTEGDEHEYVRLLENAGEVAYREQDRQQIARIYRAAALSIFELEKTEVKQ
jgi:hypothetical protein